MQTILVGYAILFFLLFGMAAMISLKERERHAAALFLAMAAGLPILYLAVALWVLPAAMWPAWILVLAPPLTALILLFPLDPIRKRLPVSPPPRFRFDERDIMFSRRLLIPGTRRFADYYKQHPDKKRLDDEWRKKPGLLKPGARFYHPLWFTAGDATYNTIEALWPLVEGEPSQPAVPVDAAEVTRFLKDWLRRSGAHSVGVTELQDYHIYSHRGRQEPYGEEIHLTHRGAIAFTVEMNKALIDYAPQAPVVLESADQYLRAATLAVKTAMLIRQLGYPARAHIDGNYQVICPLVARDAGLGEIGRMGLLMTPRLGPRVRIGVVTTDIPLIPDGYRADLSMIDFCRNCRKCAENCPGRAISFDDRREEGGVLRWRINHEACFSYWASAGTDCARCMQVCPYSHPDNGLHNLVRAGVRHSQLFRRLAIELDDLFYRRKPPVRPWPGEAEAK